MMNNPGQFSGEICDICQSIKMLFNCYIFFQEDQNCILCYLPNYNYYLNLNEKLLKIFAIGLL